MRQRLKLSVMSNFTVFQRVLATILSLKRLSAYISNFKLLKLLCGATETIRASLPYYQVFWLQPLFCFFFALGRNIILQPNFITEGLHTKSPL